MSNTGFNRNVQVLITLRDKDLFPTTPDTERTVWKERIIGKVVLFNDRGEVALVGNRVNDLFLLPGGGVEQGESIMDGVRRECQEETGCEIEITQELGATQDFRSRDGKHCISYGFAARVISQGSLKLTESEFKIGAYVKWFSISEAKYLFASQEERVKKGEVKFYNTCFNIFRDSLFVHMAQTPGNKK